MTVREVVAAYVSVADGLHKCACVSVCVCVCISLSVCHPLRSCTTLLQPDCAEIIERRGPLLCGVCVAVWGLCLVSNSSSCCVVFQAYPVTLSLCGSCYCYSSVLLLIFMRLLLQWCWCSLSPVRVVLRRASTGCHAVFGVDTRRGVPP